MKIHFETKFSRLDPLTRQDIYYLFLIKFAVSSTGIEGNTINLALFWCRFIGIHAVGSPLYEQGIACGVVVHPPATGSTL
ncbi:MAG: hypothetical protein AABX13_02785 [Nanoarchaeota archaeon]